MKSPAPPEGTEGAEGTGLTGENEGTEDQRSLRILRPWSHRSYALLRFRLDLLLDRQSESGTRRRAAVVRLVGVQRTASVNLRSFAASCEDRSLRHLQSRRINRFQQRIHRGGTGRRDAGVPSLPDDHPEQAVALHRPPPLPVHHR